MTTNPMVRRAATLSGILGVGLMGLLHWLVFFWVPTERTQGVVHRILFIHVPAAWVGFLAFGIVAICSALFLWRKDDRLDTAASAAAEGGMVFTTLVLLTGPLWGRIAWGTWWLWDLKLTLTVLLWFIYFGYFLVRASTENPERGKRFAAVIGIVGALDLPLIYFSVSWFRSIHPGPVVFTGNGPGMDPKMLATLLLGLGASTLVFVSLFIFRYRLGRLEQALMKRQAHGPEATLEGSSG